MWGAAAERQGADQHPQTQAAVLAGPAGHDLHAHRVDGRSRHAGQSAQHDGYGKPIRKHRNRRRRRGRAPRADRNHLACFENVRQIERRTDQSADDESDLDRHREPRGVTGRQAPLVSERRDDSRRRKPDAHREEFGQRQQTEGAPLRGYHREEVSRKYDGSTTEGLRREGSPRKDHGREEEWPTEVFRGRQRVNPGSAGSWRAVTLP